MKFLLRILKAMTVFYLFMSDSAYATIRVSNKQRDIYFVSTLLESYHPLILNINIYIYIYQRTNYLTSMKFTTITWVLMRMRVSKSR